MSTEETPIEPIEPIPVFFPIVNRTAIYLKRKMPFYDWLVSVNEDNALYDNLPEEASLYLIASTVSEKEFDTWLEHSYLEIFENELNEWYTDPQIWPADRNLEIFKEWFELSYCDIVWDLGKRDLQRN